MKNTLYRILSLALSALLCFGLCACPAGEPTGTTGTSGSGTTTGGKPGTHPDDVTDPIYANGAAIDGAGASLAEGCFALTEPSYNPSGDEEKANVGVLFRGGAIPETGKSYKIVGNAASVMTAMDKTYDFNGAIVIAPNGIAIEDSAQITVKNLIIIGRLSVSKSSDVLLQNVAVIAEGETALTLDGESERITLAGCRLVGATAVSNAASDFALTDSYVKASASGIADTSAARLAVTGCLFEGASTAISTASSYAQIRENSFNLARDAVGIALSGKAINILVAQNEILGAQQSLVLNGTTNTAVVLNTAVTLVAENATSLYLCDNALGGRIRAKNNNYLLADGNTYPEDGLDHTALQAGNQNTNGDSVTDVDARLEYGADETLLPHTNKDLFLEMERMDSVREGATEVNMRADTYVSERAKTQSVVILAPGAYTLTYRLDFTAHNSNTTVYAYGAYFERPYTETGNLGNMVHAVGASNITLKGCTIGFERQSCGQVYVLDKLDNNRLLVVTGAGMDNEFGNSNTALYAVGEMGAQRENTFYAYADLGFKRVTKRTDGLMEIEVSSSVYEVLAEGDILTCRSKQGNNTFFIHTSSNITFKDVSVYGNSGAFMALENYNLTATTYYRLHNTTKSGPIISEEVYSYYKGLEEQYGVNLEVYVDELGRYRGSLPHIGSIDATHTTGCAQGSVAVSCIFENMCDDATNQNHTHARVHELIDNGNGTTTVVYKGNFSSLSYNNGGGTGAGTYCVDFKVGDRVYAYNSEGKLLCDTEALTATAKYMVEENGKLVQKTVFDKARYDRYRTYHNTNPAESQFYTNCFFVTVKTDDVNFDAVEGYDMTANSSASNENRVLIDNMSMASNGFIFDNCLSQNIRSRGLLIKASEGKILNCTFRNIGMSCAAILYEIQWGESGVSEHLEIARNLMDHTGYFKYIDRYSPIAIEGLGNGTVEEDYLLYKDIRIVGNVIRNRTTEFAVFIQAAREVTVEDNDFGYFADGESEEKFSRAIKLNGAMNIKIEGNTYSPLNLPIEENIVAAHIKNIYGGDVGQSFPDEE